MASAQLQLLVMRLWVIPAVMCSQFRYYTSTLGKTPGKWQIVQNPTTTILCCGYRMLYMSVFAYNQATPSHSLSSQLHQEQTQRHARSIQLLEVNFGRHVLSHVDGAPWLFSCHRSDWTNLPKWCIIPSEVSLKEEKSWPLPDRL